jgi:uncharacterized membrane protein
MDATLGAVLSLLMRWLHITSVITIVGGFVYARFMVAPALASLSPVDAAAFSKRVVALFRPILYTALAVVLISGLYNYLTKPFYPPHYHAVIGVKFLFVLHVFAASVMYTIPTTNDAKRIQRLNWLIISGLVIVALSAGLRWMTLNPGLLK